MRAVDRIFSVLDAFTPEQNKLTLQEISDRIDLSKATTFRLVNSLDEAGYLIRLEDQRYCLSMKILRLAGVVASGISIRDIARPVMMEIARATDETISLNTVVGADRVCIDVVESTSRLMYIVTLGEHASLLYGATAKTLLAHLEESERAGIVKTLPRNAPYTQSQLKAELEQIRRDGFSCTRGERVAGSQAISVALYDIHDKVNFALTLTGPDARMSDKADELLQLMLTAQREISAKMGSSRFPV